MARSSPSRGVAGRASRRCRWQGLGITRAWQDGCGPSDEVQERIAEALARTARGLIPKDRSARETRRLASVELQRQSVAAGVNLPKAALARLCRLTGAWVARFAEMRVARDYTPDHKRYSDKHEYRAHRSLTREPMEVLMGDVHHADLSIADAMLSSFRAVQDAAVDAVRQGSVILRVSIIGWMDVSSHYLWATPVILGPGQGITQRDVALSLHAVVTCPCGGIPREILINNGSEFAALGELSGLGVIKCPPYSPEGKGRLEGAFGILEERFPSALPGYIAGDRMKSPTKSKGKPVAPCPHGPDQLHAETVAITDRNGAKAKGAMVRLQKEDMARRIASADRAVDVQTLLSEAADLEPVAFNPPDQWTVTSLDKAGVIGGAMTEWESGCVVDEDIRAFWKEHLADKGGVKRGASGGNRIGPSCAT